MSDTDKKETLSLGSGTRPLGLRKTSDSAPAVTPRVGKGGGRKNVAVEVVRKRQPSRTPAKKTEVETPVETPAEEAPATIAEEKPKVEKPSLDTKTRHVLRTLSDDEKAMRGRALGNARAADEAARKRAEVNAERQANEEARLAEERGQAEQRRLDEEGRKRQEEEARRKAAEEATRKLNEPEMPPAAPPPEVGAAPTRARKSGAELQAEEETSRRRRGGGDKRPAAPRSRGEPRRRTGKLTVTEALSGKEERVRSLASVTRAREREREARRNAMMDSPVKVVREVVVPESITVQELANRMAERGVDVIRVLMGMGVMATVNQAIDADTAELVISEFGHKLRRVAAADVEIGLKGDADDEGNLQSRPPVVTVMGHVDHGKTSLLDAIREADVVSGEAGGITQHIGAYQVESPSGGKITFIDTPGHAAFTAMRARGAQVTDLVILVVAADDGVMPQTIEAINHAKEAEVPLLVAVNKMDLPGADPSRVKQELLQHEVIAEEFGGDIQIIEVSALQKQGLDTLEEAILLQAEMLDLKANPERGAVGVVVEAKLDRGRGPVATVLVQQGTLNIGDIFVVGSESGRVRALLDSNGNNLESAGPAMPVEVLGLNGAPGAGDEFTVVENEGRAREVADYRQSVERERRAVTGARGSLEQMFDQIKAGERAEFPLIVKADVQGSVEAIIAAGDKMGNDEVSARVIHSGVGGITESDVELARASQALIIGFNVRANGQARAAAKQEGIDIRYYSIIYELVDDLRQAMSGLLAPEMRETSIGNAQVLEVFGVSKIGKVAGCRVIEGVVRRNCNIRLLRDDVVIHDGPLKSLKRFKDDVPEVREGTECGVALANYQDIQSGDRLEFYEVEEIERTL